MMRYLRQNKAVFVQQRAISEEMELHKKKNGERSFLKPFLKNQLVNQSWDNTN
eukprot:c2576_g1_i1 orf=82-240(-)